MEKIEISILKTVFILLALVVFLPVAGALAQITEEIAKAIVDYREKNGAYKTSEDLLDVPGMTQDFMEELNPIVLDGDVVYDPDAEPALAPSKC